METTEDLSPIQSEFSISAAQRLSRIGILLFELRQDRNDATVLDELLSMFHNLAGIGGAFGYPRLASRGRFGETLCQKMRQEDRGPGEEELQTLLDTLAALKCLLKIEQPMAESRMAQQMSRGHAPRVLVLEWMDPARRAWIERLAMAGMVGIGVSTPEELIHAMGQQPADAILADADLLAREQFRFLRDLRAMKLGHPIILLVGTLPSIEAKMAALRHGADAYVDHASAPAQVIARLTQLLDIKHPQDASIMVVEDDPVQTAWLRAILQPVGYQVHTCREPRHFEQELAVARPDVLILDLMLPGGIRGSDLAHFVRQHAVYQDVPIIFLSGCDHNQMRVAAVQATGLHLQKPVTPDILLKAVAGCLRGFRRHKDRETQGLICAERVA